MQRMGRNEVIAAVAAGRSLGYTELSSLDLSGLDLTGADFNHSILIETDLSNCKLRGVNFCRADLTAASVRNSDMTGSVILGCILAKADLAGTIMPAGFSVATEDEEARTLAACVEAIRANRDLWDQWIWHDEGYDPATAPEVGACGVSHNLAGWAQALQPLDFPYRSIDAQSAGWLLLPRAARARWFSTFIPELTALVNK